MGQIGSNCPLSTISNEIHELESQFLTFKSPVNIFDLYTQQMKDSRKHFSSVFYN